MNTLFSDEPLGGTTGSSARYWYLCLWLNTLDALCTLEGSPEGAPFTPADTPTCPAIRIVLMSIGGTPTGGGLICMALNDGLYVEHTNGIALTSANVGIERITALSELPRTAPLDQSRLLVWGTDLGGTIAQCRLVVLDALGHVSSMGLIRTLGPGRPMSAATSPTGSLHLVFDGRTASLRHAVDNDEDGVPDELGSVFAGPASFPLLEEGVQSISIDGPSAVEVRAWLAMDGLPGPGERVAHTLYDVDLNGVADATSATALKDAPSSRFGSPEFTELPPSGTEHCTAKASTGSLLELWSLDEQGVPSQMLRTGVSSSDAYAEVEFLALDPVPTRTQLQVRDVTLDLQSSVAIAGEGFRGSGASNQAASARLRRRRSDALRFDVAWSCAASAAPPSVACGVVSNHAETTLAAAEATDTGWRERSHGVYTQRRGRGDRRVEFRVDTVAGKVRIRGHSGNVPLGFDVASASLYVSSPGRTATLGVPWTVQRDGRAWRFDVRK